MSTNRRDFMLRLMQGATLASTGGLGWAYLLRQEARAQPFALRPPGALPDDDFNAACIKCGQCVVACPFDTLKLEPAVAICLSVCRSSSRVRFLVICARIFRV